MQFSQKNSLFLQKTNFKKISFTSPNVTAAVVTRTMTTALSEMRSCQDS